MVARARRPADASLPTRAALAAGLAAAGIFLALTLPGLRGALWYIGWFTQPDPRNALAAWADVTLAPGNYLYKEDPDVLDPDWGGYTGVTPFNIFRPHYSPLERPLKASARRSDSTASSLMSNTSVCWRQIPAIS